MKEIKLTQGRVAVVDDDDYKRLSAYKWYYNKGYAVRKLYINAVQGQKMIGMHREILKITGKVHVDHIDGNSLNNQKFNLRPCTIAENSRNRGKSVKNNSGFKGVSFDPGRKKFIAFIGVNGKTKYLGRFISAQDAAVVYNANALKFHGEFARLNAVETS